MTALNGNAQPIQAGDEFSLPLAEEKQQTLQLEISDGASTPRSDRDLLFEALADLLSNAIIFTDAVTRHQRARSLKAAVSLLP